MQNKKLGFHYAVSLKKIREYQRIPLEKRLTWLYQGNILRMHYPGRIRRLQNKFRRGEI
jgi:hypothetical protein